MAVAVFTDGATDLLKDTRQRTDTLSILSSSEASRTLLKVLLNTRLERGALNSSLSADAVATPEQIAKIRDYREIVEAVSQASAGTGEVTGIIAEVAEELQDSVSSFLAIIRAA